MKLPHRRQFLHLAAGSLALPALSYIARAQTYPTRPITLVVPFAAGGPTDTIARVMAEKMRALLGQPFVIENVTGANGSIGVGRAVRAIADGYTLSLGSNSTHALNGVVYTLGYDLLEDLEPVALLAGFPQVVVGKKGIPDNDLSGLIVWLKGTSKNSDLRGFVRV